MSNQVLETVEVEPSVPATHSVIFLHGLGADGHDFQPIVPLFGCDAEPAARFVLPHAPVRPVTINMGMEMRAWYDIRTPDLGTREDEGGVLESTAQCEQLIAREIERGIPASRIVLAGFSQGGAIALHAGLRHRERLAGIVALSTYLLRGETLEREASEANRDVPILQAHGVLDPMVRVERGTSARDALTAGGWNVEWHEYPMQHEVCPPEIDVVGQFLRRVLV